MIFVKIFALFAVLVNLLNCQYFPRRNLFVASNSTTEFSSKDICGGEYSSITLTSPNYNEISVIPRWASKSLWIHPYQFDDNLIDWAFTDLYFGYSNFSDYFAIVDTQNIIYWGLMNDNFQIIGDVTKFDNISLATTCFDIEIWSNFIFVDCNSNGHDYIYVIKIPENEVIFLSNLTQTSNNGLISGYNRKIKVIASFDNQNISVLRYYISNTTFITQNSYIQIFSFENFSSLSYQYTIDQTTLGRSTFYLADFDSFFMKLYIIFQDGTFYIIMNWNNQSTLNFYTHDFNLPLLVSNMKVFPNYNLGSASINCAVATSTYIYLYRLDFNHHFKLIKKFELDISADILRLELTPNYIFLMRSQASVNILKIDHEIFSKNIYATPIARVNLFRTLNDNSFLTMSNMYGGLYSVTSSDEKIVFTVNDTENITTKSCSFLCGDKFLTQTNYTSLPVNDANIYFQNFSLTEKTFSFQNLRSNSFNIGNFFLGPNISYEALLNNYTSYSKVFEIVANSSNQFSNIVFIESLKCGINVCVLFQTEDGVLHYLSYNQKFSKYKQMNMTLSSQITQFTAAYINDTIFVGAIEAQNLETMNIYTVGNEIVNFGSISLQNDCINLQLTISTSKQLLLFCSYIQDSAFWQIMESGISQQQNLLSSLQGLNSNLSFINFSILEGFDLIYFIQESSIVIWNFVYLCQMNYSSLSYMNFERTINTTSTKIIIFEDNIIIYSIQENFISEYVTSLIYLEYLSKNYILWEYKLISDPAVVKNENRLAFAASLGEDTYLLIFQMNQPANNNLKYIIPIDILANQSVLVEYLNSDYVFDYFVVCQNSQYSIYKVNREIILETLPESIMNNVSITSSIQVIASNYFDNTNHSGAEFLAKIWNPTVEISFVTNSSNITLFEINNGSSIEYLTYPFYDFEYFNGTILDFDIIMEYSSDSDYVSILPRIFPEDEIYSISSDTEIIDMIEINQTIYVLTAESILSLSNVGYVDSYILNNSCMTINSDFNNISIILLCEDENNSIVKILNSSFSLTSDIILNTTFEDPKVIVVESYIFILERYKSIYIYYMEYSSSNIVSLVQVFTIDDLLMDESMILSDFDVGLIYRGFRFFMTDLNFGLRTLDTEFDKLEYRAYFSPGIPLLEDKNFLNSGLASSNTILSLKIEQNFDLYAYLLISTESNSFYLKWQMDSEAENSNATYIQTFIGSYSEKKKLFLFGSNLISLFACSKKNYCIEVFDKSNTSITYFTPIGFIDIKNEYFGNIIGEIYNNFINLTIPISNAIQNYNISKYPLITFLSGRIASTFMSINASNKISSQMLNINLNNVNPALTHEQQMIKLLIISIIVLIVLSLLFTWAWRQFSKANEKIKTKDEINTKFLGEVEEL